MGPIGGYRGRGALKNWLDITLDLPGAREHCHARFMSHAVTMQRLTREIASAGIVRRDQRMSWQVTKNYPSTGRQEEQD